MMYLHGLPVFWPLVSQFLLQVSHGQKRLDSVFFQTLKHNINGMHYYQ